MAGASEKLSRGFSPEDELLPQEGDPNSVFYRAGQDLAKIPSIRNARGGGKAEKSRKKNNGGE